MLDPKEIIQYLTVLELPIDRVITESSIRSQYRSLAHIYHPDVAPQRYKDGEKFKYIGNAAEYLIEHLDEVNNLIRHNYVISTTASTTSTHNTSTSSKRHSSPQTDYPSKPKEQSITDRLLKTNDLTLLDGYYYAPTGTPLSSSYFFAFDGQLYYALSKNFNKYSMKGIYKITFGNDSRDRMPLWIRGELIKLIDIKEKDGFFMHPGKMFSFFYVSLEKIDKDSAYFSSDILTHGCIGRDFVHVNGPHNDYRDILTMNDLDKCPVCGAALRWGKCTRSCHKLMGV